MPDIGVFDFHFHFSSGKRSAGLKKTIDGGEVSGILCCTDLRVKNEEFEEKNRELLELAAKKGRKILPLLAVIHPNQPEWERFATKWFDKFPQLAGIKLHPPSSGYLVTPELMDPLFDFALARNLVVASHTCPVPGQSAIAFHDSLKRRREIKFVIYHGSTHEESAYLAEAFPNVYVEPSWLGFFPNLFQLMRKLGGYIKMLAGTDGPGWFDSFKGSPYDDLVQLARKHLPDEETVKDFCARNAKRFLGID
jgi:predicted TIM-barrel fold metal-dependent hydrolase